MYKKKMNGSTEVFCNDHTYNKNWLFTNPLIWYYAYPFVLRLHISELVGNFAGPLIPCVELARAALPWYLILCLLFCVKATYKWACRKFCWSFNSLRRACQSRLALPHAQSALPCLMLNRRLITSIPTWWTACTALANLILLRASDIVNCRERQQY
jgi:hypothetical protein